MWVGPGDSKIYFDCTTGGAANLGQVWGYDPGRETITLIYESTSVTTMQNPDNIVIVPKTGDIFLQEDGSGEQFVRGLTRDGEIYDFCKTETSQFGVLRRLLRPGWPDVVPQSAGEHGDAAVRPPGRAGDTYAIFGPFEKREGDRSR